MKSPGLVGEFTRYEITLIIIREGVNEYLIADTVQTVETPWMASAIQGVRNSDKWLKANLHGFVRAGRDTQFTSYAFFMVEQDMHIFSFD